MVRGSAHGKATGSRGRLHVYLGSAPGVGKTFAMLTEGHRLVDGGVDAVCGLVETHGRVDTEAIVAGLEPVAVRHVCYRGTTFAELDVDAVLARQPALVLVDELAHTCVPGSRHDKRWEDIEELLDAGIDVVTTLNVQHLDSLHGQIEDLTGVAQRETVPDAVVASADRVELVDVAPEQLRSRIARSEVVGGATAGAALGGFFSEDRLRVLHQIALTWLTEHGFVDRRSAGGPAARAPVVVALTGAPEGEHTVRRAARIASQTDGELVGVHVREPSGLTGEPTAWLDRQRRLLNEFGGRYAEVGGTDVASAVLDFAGRENAKHLVLGATRRSRRDELLHGSVINKAIRAAGPIEVHVIPARRPPRRIEAVARAEQHGARTAVWSAQRRTAAWLLSVIAPTVVVIGLTPFRSSLGLAGVLLCALVTVVGVAVLGGIRPALLATTIAVLLSDFYFTEPLHSFRVAHLVDVVALATFAAVGAAVGTLVAAVAAEAVEVARSEAEAANLARLAAASLADSRDIAGVVDTIREVFDLRTVAVLRRTKDGWDVEAFAGVGAITEPNDADYQADISQDRVLVLAGRRSTDVDSALLNAFVGGLRLAHQRSVLRGLDPIASP